MKSEDKLTIIIVAILVIVTISLFISSVTKSEVNNKKVDPVSNIDYITQRNKEIKAKKDSLFVSSYWRVQDIKDQYNAGKMSKYNFKQLINFGHDFRYWSDEEYYNILEILKDSYKIEVNKIFNFHDVIDEYIFYKDGYKFKLYSKLN